MNRRFARLSPVFIALGIAAAGICGGVYAGPTPSAATQSKRTLKREAADAQFARAEKERATLNGKPTEKRTLSEYKQAVTSYRRVYLITPHAREVVDALLSVAELYTEMGDHFGRSYYQSAVDAYQFLVHEYPTSKYTQDALLRIGKLQRDQLGDSTQATKTYQDFLKKYPHSRGKREAQEALAEMALVRHSESVEAAGNAKSGEQATGNSDEVRGGVDAGDSGDSGRAPRIRRITASANADTTRVTIDLENTVQYTSARIFNPERIFFDLHSARLTPEVARGTVKVTGDLLTGVRVAQNHADVVRVVLDVKGVKDYAATLQDNPPQLVIYLYSDLRHHGLLHADNSKTAKPNRGAVQASEEAAAGSENAGNVRAVAAKNPPVEPRVSAASKVDPGAPSRGKPSRGKRLSATNTNPDLIRPTGTPEPTRDGQSTLTRALGLKISRIVIDPGHGGHDTGTIGPTGLMEKDLCLDVALRLGKIIRQKLPAAEIIYTRSDDTFVPLEERTKIANEAKADLFISIHANSSRDHAARGVETYYLNLKGSAEAMEVAARENASSDQGVHSLEDMVKKIAQNEKVDESKEFAEDIQDSLATRMRKLSRSVKDRGVRKAPFVVLIGADMPSILTEISFLSNPSDEKLLKKPEYRQRVAEGLYQGVVDYLQSMNSVTLNLPTRSASRRAGQPTPVEQSRNQR
ncbi:MAG: N-acetylmuramoyl-L-alanine amidase [Candidatus Acidiferrum sp.]